MKIVALDPGAKFGWAVYDTETRKIFSGVWNLTPKRNESPGAKWIRFTQFLGNILTDCQPDLVVFEEVRRHMGTSAAHAYGGYKSQIEEVCAVSGVTYTTIPVGTVKKFATGKGNADKKRMIAAANETWPGANITDDNEADARFIALATAQELGVR